MLNKTIELFLDSIGRREEYEYYLKRFHDSSSPAFALICPERLGFQDMAEVLSFDLDFLLRLEIYPALLLCGEGAEEMLEVLEHGTHPFSVLRVGLSSAAEEALGEIIGFLKICRAENRIGFLAVEDCDLEQALEQLLPAVSKRVHIIRLRGPLHDECDRELMNYYTRRSDQPTIALEDAPLLAMAEGLLEMNPDLHISVASPLNLLEELFTVRGAGCLVRRGSVIKEITDIAEIEVDRLTALMHSSFGREIRAGVIERAGRIFVEENYRGAALLEEHSSGLYLSKFAVDTQARGEGLASEIWSEILAGNPPLFWRARSLNSINHWYLRQSDGHQSLGEWTVYWRGVDWRHIPAIIDTCIDRPDDFA